MKTKNKANAFTLVEIMIIVVIIGLLAAMAIPAINKVRGHVSHTQYYQEEYDLWCKLNRRSDITYDEWYKLRQANLLNQNSHE